MKITKGTPQAMSLFAELKKSRDLIDIYSKDFFDQRPTKDEDPSAPFPRDWITWIESIESDPEQEEIWPKNHLIFIFLDRFKKELHERLKRLYPPLKNTLEAGHLPDFLLLNLYTKQVLCAGLGRKNRLFIIDAKTNKSINAFNLLETNIDDSVYMNKFLTNDVYDSVSDLLHALNQLGTAIYKYDHLPGNEELAIFALKNQNVDDGLYYIEGDEMGYTEHEIQEFIDQYQEYREQQDKAMNMIRVFFPQCERGELDTGDY